MLLHSFIRLVQVPWNLRDDSPWVDSRQVSKSGFEGSEALHFAALNHSPDPSPEGSHNSSLQRLQWNKKKNKKNFNSRRAMGWKNPYWQTAENGRHNLTSDSVAWQVYAEDCLICQCSLCSLLMIFFQQRTQRLVWWGKQRRLGVATRASCQRADWDSRHSCHPLQGVDLT